MPLEHTVNSLAGFFSHTNQKMDVHSYTPTTTDLLKHTLHWQPFSPTQSQTNEEPSNYQPDTHGFEKQFPFCFFIARHL